jgi:hypothetical protein
MALRLNAGKPKARRVEIGGGVALLLRAATYGEAMEAAERIQPLIVGLRDGSDAAIELGDLLGEEFAGAVWSEAALNAAAHKLALVELIVLCCEGIEGELIGTDDVPIDKIDSAIAALLVRDSVISRSLRAVIEGPLHEVLAEKKESGPSPNGVAARPDTAPDAGSPAPRAPAAGAE